MMIKIRVATYMPLKASTQLYYRYKRVEVTFPLLIEFIISLDLSESNMKWTAMNSLLNIMMGFRERYKETSHLIKKSTKVTVMCRKKAITK